MIKLKNILKEYQILIEKISKKEFDDALKSTDIMIGSEFEGNWLKNMNQEELEKEVSKIVGSKKINFVSYHGGNKNEWNFQEDSSLGNYGLELTGPPLKLQDWLKTTPKLFKLLTKAGGTDSKTGFHINISFKNSDKKINPLKLLLFFEEEKIYKFFQNRKNNSYAKSIKYLFDKDLKTPKTKTKKLDNIEQELSSKLSINRYYGVNLGHLLRQNYVEFRQIGGNGYEKKWNEIKNLVAMYITVMKIASDSNYKRKEYIKKLYKLSDNIELKDEIKLDKNLYKNIKNKVKTFNGQKINVEATKKISKHKKLIDFIKNNDFKDAELSINNNEIIWENGIWKDGIWEDGIWKDGIWKWGTWENGTWENGTWEGGTWNNGTWNNGTWKWGTWQGGTWKDGIWNNGTWNNGTWNNGTWKYGIWKYGIWNNGTWKYGIWEYGIWKSKKPHPNKKEEHIIKFKDLIFIK